MCLEIKRRGDQRNRNRRFLGGSGSFYLRKVINLKDSINGISARWGASRSSASLKRLGPLDVSSGRWSISPGRELLIEFLDSFAKLRF